MKLKHRITCVMMIAALMIGVCGCSNDGDTRVIFTTGFAKDEVFRIEDVSCTKSELMVYLTNTQNQYENVYGSPIWEVEAEGITLEENVKETVLAKIAQIKTMYLLAKEKGVVLEEAEEAKVLQTAEEYYTSLSNAEIEQMGVTREIIEQLYREYALAEKVYQHIIQDINPEISDDEARTITVQHILVRTVSVDADGNNAPYSEEKKQEAYRKISDIRELATNGTDDFAELASQYSDDSTITYSFGKGEMDVAFENASFSLGTGEISDIIESEAGYHIIKCLNTFNREETDANKLEIVEQRRKEVFGREYDVFVSGLVRDLNQNLWEDIGLLHDSEVDTADFFEIYEKNFTEE